MFHHFPHQTAMAIPTLWTSLFSLLFSPYFPSSQTLNPQKKRPRGVMQMAKPFAECLGFEEGEQIEVFSHSAPLARSVMVQPMLSSSGVYRIYLC
jgi:hypothetical protein